MIGRIGTLPPLNPPILKFTSLLANNIKLHLPPIPPPMRPIPERFLLLHFPLKLALKHSPLRLRLTPPNKLRLIVSWMALF